MDKIDDDINSHEIRKQTNISNTKKHIIFLSLIVLIFIGTYYSNFSPSKNPLTDPYSYYFPAVETVRQSVFDYKDYNILWNPYKFGGSSVIENILPNVFSPIGIYLVITNNAIVAIKIWELSVILIAGLCMYFLIFSHFKKPSLGFLAALIYMNNGYPLRYLSDGNLFTLTGYAFLPLLFYFFLKVFKTKDLIKQSVIFGIILGCFFWFSPDFKVFPFFMIFVGVYTLLYISNLKKSSLHRMIIFYLIFSLIFAGIALPKILPVKEGLEGSWRENFSYEQIKNSRRVEINQLFGKIIEPVYEGMPKIRRDLTATAHLGIIAFLLMIYGFYRRYKNRLVMALGISALLSILIAMGTPVLYLLWKFVPGFSSFRFIERALVLFVVCSTILAVFGANELIKKFKERRKRNIVILTLIILIILNLIVFNFKGYPEGEWVADLDKLNKENEMLKYISEQDGFFRYHPVESVAAGWTTEPFTIPYKIEQLYGYGSHWNVDYFNTFLGTANKAPAKLWGIMNTKFISSTTQINVSGFKLIKKFEDCNYCAPMGYSKINGPYLYENEENLPRVYNTKSSILIVGSKETVTQISYGIILNDLFDPKNQIIVFGKEKLNSYKIDELKRFDNIILTQGSVSGNSEESSLLNQYVNVGGRLFPDITKGVNQFTNEEITKIISNISDNYNPIKDSDIIRYNFDKISIKINEDIKGWIVLSEKFSLFDGWEAYTEDRDLNIYRVNGVVSAVYLDEPVGNIVFEYKPKSYILSRNILFLTLAVILIYFGYYFYRRVNKK